MGVDIQPEPLLRGQSDIERRYAGAALWMTIGGVTSRIFQGLAPLALARALGATDYGKFAIIGSFIAALINVSSLGQNAALQKFLPEYVATNPRRGGVILGNTVALVGATFAVASIAIFFSSAWLARVVYQDVTLTAIFRWSAALVFVLSAFNLGSSIAAGLQDYANYALAMVARSIGFLVLGVIGAIGWGLPGAIAGQMVSGAVGLALLTATDLKLAKAKFANSLSFSMSSAVLREIIGFALPALLASLVVMPAYWLANTLLARVAGFEELGRFGLAFAIAQVVMLVPLSVSTPAISFFSEAHAAYGVERFRSLASTTLRLVWALTIPIFLFVVLVSGPLIVTLFGRNYAPVTRLLPWMCLAGLLIVIAVQIGAVVASLGRMWQAFLLNVVWLVLFLGPAWLWVSHHSMGLAAAFVGSYFAYDLILWRYSERVLRVRFEAIVPLCALTCAALAIAVLPSYGLNPGAAVGVGVAACLALLWAEWTWVLTPDERAHARGRCAGLYRRLLQA